MTEYELLKLIQEGENIHVEFKKSTNEITKDVYDTVCSFSNREGGTIVLGIKDNGDILGIAPNAVDHLKKDFVTTINNGEKINPPLYLQPEEYSIEGKIILVIQVPVASQVCRHRGRILIETTRPILISPITPTWYISYMREKAVAISSIKSHVFN